MKKVSALILSFVILITTTQVLAFSDIEGHKSEKAVTVLNSLGILEGKSENSFEPDGLLKRDEAAKIFAKVMGVDSTTGSQVFEDVPSTHWAYNHILATYNLGIIKGTSVNTFSPEENLTYSQAVKMMVCALGYEVQAENLGGYPSGYLAKASQLGILKGIKILESGLITRGDMAILLFNSLDVELLEKTTFGPGAYTYTTSPGVTLLSKYSGIYQSQGIITANYYVKLSSAERSLTMNEIAIGSKVYNAGKTNADELIGINVKVYFSYPDNSDIPVVLSVLPESNSKVLKVDALDINDKTTKSKLIYNDGVNQKSAEIKDLAVFVLNGKVKTDWVESDIMPNTGTVTLISNDGTSADFVIVNSYINFVVDTRNADTNTVYFKDSVNGLDLMVLEESDSSVKLSLKNKDGSYFTVSDLAEWDILSVENSQDGKVIQIIRSTDKIFGEVKEVSDEEVHIDSQSVRIAYSLKNSSTSLEKPKTGMKADFYLDYMGRIAAIDSNSNSEGMYGFMVGASYTKGLGRKPQFKIFTGEGKMEVYDTTEFVNLNGSVVSNEELLDGLNPLFSGGQVLRQIILFDVNESKLITKIKTAKDYTIDYDNEQRYEEFSKDFYIDGNSNSDGVAIKYKGGNLDMFAGKILARDQTKIFVIPEADAEDSDYTLIKYTSLLHDTDGGDYRNVTFYDIDEGGIAEVMVWDIGSASTDTDLPNTNDLVGMVIEITKGITEDGEACTYLSLLNEKKQVLKGIIKDKLQVYFGKVHTDLINDPKCVNGVRNSKIEVSDLNKGDMVQYKVNTKNEFTMLNAVFRVETPGEYDQCWNSYTSFYPVSKYSNYGGIATAYGKVAYVGDSTVKAFVNKINDPITKYERIYPKPSVILLFDKEKKTYKEISLQDIQQDDVISSVWRTYFPLFIVVYR